MKIYLPEVLTSQMGKLQSSLPAWIPDYCQCCLLPPVPTPWAEMRQALLVTVCMLANFKLSPWIWTPCPSVHAVDWDLNFFLPLFLGYPLASVFAHIPTITSCGYNPSFLLQPPSHKGTS